MPEDFDTIVARFVGSLEQLFHYDWEYTKEMLGIHSISDTPLTDAQIVRFREMFPLLDDPESGSDSEAPDDSVLTFLQTGLSREDEVEDWGSRGRFLEDYRKLLAAMAERGLQPIPPFPRENGNHS